MTTPRVGLVAMLRGGLRDVWDYIGLTLGVFAVQTLVAMGAGLVIAQLFASELATRPVFDDAIDGDLVSMIEVARQYRTLGVAAIWIAVGAVLAWLALSWFIAGGVLAVYTTRPIGRAETARCFGAGGASTFFAFLRVSGFALALHVMLVIPALLLGLGAVADTVEHALTMSELVGALVLGLAPAALLAVLIGTLSAYARTEIAMRHATHELGAMLGYLRAGATLVRRPIALLHALLGWLAFLAISAIFVLVSKDHAMLGTGGAISLLVIRMGVSLLRLSTQLAVIGGQVELAKTRPPPARRVDVA